MRGSAWMGLWVTKEVPGYESAECRGVGQSVKALGYRGLAEGAGAGCAGGEPHLCGPCLRGCSGPAAVGPGCRASPRPSSRRAAAASAWTWCRKPARLLQSLQVQQPEDRRPRSRVPKARLLGNAAGGKEGQSTGRLLGGTRGRARTGRGREDLRG